MKGSGASRLQTAGVLPPDIANPRLIRRWQGVHSELTEFAGLRSGSEVRVLVKRITRWRQWENAVAEVVGEYETLRRFHLAAGSDFAGALPRPLRVIPEQAAIVLEKLPGRDLHRLLRRSAHRLSSREDRQGLARGLRALGDWLRRFHTATRAGEGRFEPSAYLAALRPRLEACLQAGMSAARVEAIRRSAERAAARVGDAALPLAACHGDFIPQNILLAGPMISVVDFSASRPSRPVYQDIGSMQAALALLGKYPLYSAAAVNGLRAAFLEGYGPGADTGMVRLYTLQAAVGMLLEMLRGHSVRLANLVRRRCGERRVVALACEASG